MMRFFIRAKKTWLFLFSSPYKYAISLGIKMGCNCYIATKFWGSEPYLIEIGDHVQITNGVRFFTHGGGWVFREKYPDFDTFGKIKVGNNVYIGNCALIMPGVIIGNNVIIGAGSVVTKSIPAGVAVAGNPAKIIGVLGDMEKRATKYNLNTKRMSAKQKKDFLLAQEDDKFILKPFLEKRKDN